MGDNRQQPLQQQQKQKSGGRGIFSQIKYFWGVGVRYYSTIFQEAILAAVFVTPFWAYFHYSGQLTITIPTDFVTLVSIAFMVFLMQNSMFRRN